MGDERSAPAGLATVAVRRRAVRPGERGPRAAERELPPVALRGGDLWRAVGGVDDPRRFEHDVAILPVDLLRVEVDGEADWAVAHVVARRWRGWRGPVVAAMNGQYVGRQDVAPEGTSERRAGRRRPGRRGDDGCASGWQARAPATAGHARAPRQSSPSRSGTGTRRSSCSSTLAVAVDGRAIGARPTPGTITSNPTRSTVYVCSRAHAARYGRRHARMDPRRITRQLSLG